jgi:hypothetical protein
VVLLAIFDGTTCVGFRSMMNPPPALSLEDATPVTCEQQMNQIDPNVAVAMSNEQLQQLPDELCATSVSQLSMGMPAQPAAVLNVRGVCPGVRHSRVSGDDG